MRLLAADSEINSIEDINYLESISCLVTIFISVCCLKCVESPGTYFRIKQGTFNKNMILKRLICVDYKKY